MSAILMLTTLCCKEWIKGSLSQARESTDVNDSSKSLFELEKERDDLDDINGVRAKLLSDELIPEAASNLVWLVGANSTKSWRAEMVHLCHDFAPNEVWTCTKARTTFADDTIHVTEFPPYEAVPVFCNQRAYFKNKDGQPMHGLVRAAVGEPGDMHSHGYSNVVEVKTFNDGSFVIPCYKRKQKEPHILFAIFKDERGFRKHVWVINKVRQL